MPKIKVDNILERLTIKQVFLLWFLTSIIFALIYHLLILFNIASFSYPHGQITSNLQGFLNLIYFSFVTFTSTGFGDIVPLGLAKIFAIAEIFLGLLIFGIIVYKLVSVKQDMILEEVYSLSLEEYINRIRSNLYISRANLIRFIERIKKQNSLEETDVIDFGIISTTLNTNMTDVKRVLVRNKSGSKYIKDPNESVTSLLLTSTYYALTKLVETLKKLQILGFKDESLVSSKNVNDIYKDLTKIHEYLSKKQYEKTTTQKLKNIKSELRKLKKLI